MIIIFFICHLSPGPRLQRRRYSLTIFRLYRHFCGVRGLTGTNEYYEISLNNLWHCPFFKMPDTII